jgi:site-specific recombinase XerD
MSEYAYRRRRRTKFYHQYNNRNFKKLPHAIDPEDVSCLLFAVKKIRDKALILLLLRTGMRIGELLHTRVDDIKLKDRKIIILESEKNRIGRVVYFSDDAQKTLNAWLRKRDPSQQFLFYGKRKDFMTYTSVRTIFSRYLKKAGLSHKKYTLHCLRHTYASELLSAGMSLESLQQLLGHSSVEVTRRYARLTDKSLENDYFRAMSLIERGEIHGHYQFNI